MTMYPTIVRQVKFPCGRLGLEMETTHPAMGGSEPSYRYFYNGRDYLSLGINLDGIKLPRNWYGRIEGIKVIHREEIKLDLFELVREMSVNFTAYPTADEVPKPGRSR
jgi:hypothetical protein